MGEIYSEADRVQIRRFLGASAIFIQAIPRIESAIRSTQSIADDGSRPDDSTVKYVKSLIYGTSAVVGSDPLAWTHAADANAAAATYEGLVDAVPLAGLSVSGVLFTSSARVVADDTNYATINVYKRSGGGARSLVASGTTKITAGMGAGLNLEAGIAYALTLSGGPLIAVAKDDQVTAEITKAGTGVIIPASIASIVFTPAATAPAQPAVLGLLDIERQISNRREYVEALKADEVNIDPARGLAVLRAEGRRLVGQLADAFGTRPIRDIFSPPIIDPSGEFTADEIAHEFRG